VKTLNDVQGGLIARAKLQSALIAMLPSGTSEIKEDEWQGAIFSYPCVRLDLGPMYPIADCEMARVTFSWQAYSESPTSFEANAIASEINDLFHNKSFTQNGVRFLVCGRGLTPAIRQDERTWRAAANFQALVE
jgi:hypothetical protein